MKKLPNKPSKLIRVALIDLARAEKDPRFVIDMGTWHSPGLNGQCSVCLAGAIMATSKESRNGKAGLRISNFDRRTEKKLDAIDDFRVGYVFIALKRLGIGMPRGLSKHYVMPVYSINADKFKRAMHKLAGRLEKVGL